jgi:hypothetical protein
MAQTQKNVVRYDAGQFTWGNLHGIADASELGKAPGVPPFSRVWDDACDVGFVVQGCSRAVVFTLTKEERDADGDVRGWWFASHGVVPEVKVLIAND